MPRRKTKERTVIGLNLPTPIVEELRKTSNASDVVSDILIDHCDRIGMLTLEDKRSLIRNEIQEFMDVELEKMMKKAHERVRELFGDTDGKS